MSLALFSDHCYFYTCNSATGVVFTAPVIILLLGFRWFLNLAAQLSFSRTSVSLHGITRAVIIWGSHELALTPWAWDVRGLLRAFLKLRTFVEFDVADFWCGRNNLREASYETPYKSDWWFTQEYSKNKATHG